MIRFVLAALVSACCSGAILAEDWSRFRGPNGTGTSTEAVPVKFNSTDNLAWKTKLPGVGHGSPITVRDQIFLQTCSSDGSKRGLVCLSAKDGKIVWNQEIGGEKPRGMHKKNSYASATPCSDGERIFCSVWDGQALELYGYDLTGKVVWHQRVGSYTSQHGAANSPMTYAGMVYLNYDQDGADELIAYDAKSGKEIWRAKRKAARACYTTPLIYSKPGEPTQLILGTTGTIDSYDPKTGKVNWTFSIDWGSAKELRAVGQQVIVNDTLISYTGEGGSGRYMVALKTDGKGDITNTGKVWELRRDTPYVPSILAFKDHLYWVTDTGFAVCVSVKSGKVVWNERVFSKSVSSSAILINETVLCFDESGKGIAFLAKPDELEKVGESTLGEPVFATPAVMPGKLLVRGSEHLYCFVQKGS